METFSALLVICAGNSPVAGEFPTQRPVTQCFDVFFDLRLNEQTNGEAGDLRRHRAHYDVTVMNIFQRICTGLCPGYIISLVVLSWSYNCPCTNKVTLNDLGKIGRYPTKTKRKPYTYCFYMSCILTYTAMLSVLMVLCDRKPAVDSHHKRPVMWSFCVFFVGSLNSYSSHMSEWAVAETVELSVIWAALTHFGLVTPYGVGELGQHWSR